MIRLAEKNDMGRILEIYSVARKFMRLNGNPTQWSGKYPDEEVLLDDIENGHLFVVTDDAGGVCGCFALIGGDDPTYRYIDGAWKSDAPYGAIHRVASDGTRRGIFGECVAFARERFDHLRIDTHNDNLPMQHVILKNGFEHTGIIYIEDGSPRRAYEWIAEM